jgi:SET domain
LIPYRIGKSQIQGAGAIATHLIKEGQVIPMPPLKKEWMDFGGFNHSCVNNVSDRIPGSGLDHRRTALRDIQVGEELTVNYHRQPPGCNCEIHRSTK